MNSKKSIISLYVREEGSALISFVIAFPVFLLMIFSIMQISLLFNAKQLINYAAYTAVRTGIVSYDSNQVDESQVLNEVKKSACVVLASISPKLRIASYDLEIDASRLDLYRAGLTENFIERFEMAKTLTLAKLETSEDDLRVEITYHCPLVVPIINAIIYKGYQLTSGSYSTSHSIKYALPISATCTLQIEKFK